MNGGTGTFRSAGIVPYKDGWYYCWVAMSGVAASTAMSIYIVAENGVTYGGSGNPAWYLYGLTVMDTGSDVYTYPCQYATATRGNDQLRYAGSGQNINVSVGTAYAEIKTKWQTSWQHRTTLAADDAAKSPLMNHAGWPSTAIFIYDGNLAYQSGLPDAFTASRKVASSWNNGLLRQQVTGGGIPSGAGTSASAFTGTMATSSPYMGIGWNTGWTALALGGQIRNVKIWNVPASPSELAALTA
jgi:hypothetical protein